MRVGKVDEGRIMQERGWALTSVIYDDRLPPIRVFYVEHDCALKGQNLSYMSRADEGWEQELDKLNYIVCNTCGNNCPKNVFDKFIFLRAMNE